MHTWGRGGCLRGINLLPTVGMLKGKPKSRFAKGTGKRPAGQKEKKKQTCASTWPKGVDEGMEESEISPRGD